MVTHSDPLSDFVEMAVERYDRDHDFRLRLLAEADETPREVAKRISHDERVAAWRRAAS